MNPYYKALSSVEAPELIREFAKTAPKEVQFAVKTTVASLLGNMPPAVGDSSIVRWPRTNPSTLACLATRRIIVDRACSRLRTADHDG
jgi:hypothetical protein